MTIKSIIETLEERQHLHPNPWYDAKTYNLCKAFKSLYMVGLISNREYNKYIEFVMDIEADIYNINTIELGEENKKMFLQKIN